MTADEQAEVRTLLREAHQYIQLTRDSLYESSTNSDGEFVDPDDEAEIRETDELLDRMKAVLATEPPETEVTA